MAMSNSVDELGASQCCWSNGGAMRSIIEEVGPTIVFFAAFESDQSVGPAFDQRCLSLPILEKWDAPRRIGRNMRFYDAATYG